MNTDNKFLAILKGLGLEIKTTVLTKGSGFIVGGIAFVLTFIQMITYTQVPENIYNGMVVVFALLGLLFFVLFSLFRKTSSLAPIFLMVFDLLCVTAFASAEGLIDYLSTAFFSGFSLEAVFALPFAVWFSVLCFLLSFILSSVAIYLPQQRKEKADPKTAEVSESISGGNA